MILNKEQLYIFCNPEMYSQLQYKTRNENIQTKYL